jgi:hypothetical protein
MVGEGLDGRRELLSIILELSGSVHGKGGPSVEAGIAIEV